MTEPHDDLDLIAATTQWVSALLDSAIVADIGVANWWARAKSALETAAASADTYPQAVAAACRKLQIDTLTARSAQTLTGPGSLEDAIAPRLDEWRTLAQRDAVYIVALTQIERTEKRGKKQAAQGSLIDLDN